jgi:hypothetical protein
MSEPGAGRLSARGRSQRRRVRPGDTDRPPRTLLTTIPTGGLFPWQVGVRGGRRSPLGAWPLAAAKGETRGHGSPASDSSYNPARPGFVPRREGGRCPSRVLVASRRTAHLGSSRTGIPRRRLSIAARGHRSPDPDSMLQRPGRRDDSRIPGVSRVTRRGAARVPVPPLASGRARNRRSCSGGRQSASSTRSLKGAQPSCAQVSKSRSVSTTQAARASGSTHRNVPDWPKCP